MLLSVMAGAAISPSYLVPVIWKTEAELRLEFRTVEEHEADTKEAIQMIASRRYPITNYVQYIKASLRSAPTHGKTRTTH